MVQDYFKYDKIQGGAPLSINANDGTKTEGKQGVTLGIKSTAQGIQHFTNWNDISSSIDSKNTIRFEDGQPNKLYYKTNRSKFTAAYNMTLPTTSSPDGTIVEVMGSAEQFGNHYHEFTDEWSAEDIKILDDIAVVSYPDYTDLHRTEETFSNIQLRQPVRATWDGVYTGSPTTYDTFEGTGMVFTIDEGMPLMHKVGVRKRYTANNPTYDNLHSDTNDQITDYVAEAAQTHMSNHAYSLENTILKLWIPTNTFGDGRYLYFVYGGAVNYTVGEFGSGQQDKMMPATSMDTDGSFLFDDFRFSGEKSQYLRSKVGQDSKASSRNWNGFSDGDFAGYFYLVREASSTIAQGVDFPVEDDPSGKMHIQLSITNILDYATTDANFNGKYEVDTGGISTTTIWHGYVDVGTADAQATFIKYTPVRKCGKVDVYTKKSGIISSIVNDTITSPGHTLQTHDIIKITSALWDGTQTGAKDTHPLNGDKFVKVIDDDTFELYEDQFFEKPVSTTKLRSTSGISWVCIGNANGNEAQSWSYSQTLFSPTGKNGYRATTTGKYKTTTRYNKAFLSGTTETDTANNNGLYADFSSLPGDYEPLTEYSDNRNWGIFYNTGVKKKVTGDAVYTLASLFGKRIRDFIDNTPLVDFGNSPLDTFNKGPQDFFPFTTASINADSHPPYTGTRFGSSIDMKFSHKSGTSKIYTLVVGEPGADVSVDMFGVTEEEYLADGNFPHWLNTAETTGDLYKGIICTGRKRMLPYYMPYGKVHVFSVTVDQYGRISDITAQNSVFGDGSSVNNTSSNEEHPWETFMAGVRSNNYVGVNTAAGRRQAQGWSHNSGGTFNLDYQTATNGDRASYIAIDDELAPFNETLPDDSSLYWDRAAIANWIGTDTYDYFINSLASSPRQLRKVSPVTRNLVYTNTVNVTYSRFGSGIGRPVIDRFNAIQDSSKNQFYILPWIDMFGTSVSVSNCNDSGEILVFGSASTRSNIDYHGVSMSDSGTTVLRPVITTSSGLTSDIIDEYGVSQVGQISCIRVDRTSSYNATQIVEINAGGSVDSSTTPVDAGEVFTRDTTGTIPFTIKELRTGEELSGAADSILRSIKTSSKCILFDGEYIIWVDHNIGNTNGGYSKLNMLRVNYDNNSFEPFSNHENSFVSNTKQYPNHEGFGEYLSYSDGVLVGNALTRTNSFGVRIDSFINGVQMYDAMSVFTTSRNGLVYHQTLTATFSGLDTRYSSQLVPNYQDSILDISNINYDNNTFQSHTWNIRLAGKYSTIAGKIILKDPIEYVIFAPDYQYNTLDKGIVRNYTKQIKPYLEFSEIYKDDTVYYDYTQNSKYRIADKSMWDNTSSSTFVNTDNITRTPVFFLSIPDGSAVDNYGNLTITLDKDTVGRIFGSYWDIETTGITNVNNSFGSLLPKIALYRKDPRSMIVPNGPIHTNTNTSYAATYTNGLYDYDWSTFTNNDLAKIQTPATPPLFRGGANDLFHYSSNPGTVPEQMDTGISLDYNYTYATQYFNGESNLGELFDATYDQLGNVDKGRISWFANDIRYYTNNTANIIPYGTLISGSTAIGPSQFQFTIPYSTWSKFVVNSSLLKNSANNRPLFADSTRIKHGTVGIDSDPSTGSWDYTYDDINRPTYASQNIESSFSLILGLVFTRHTTINQSGTVSYDTSNSIWQFCRFMGPKERYDQRHSSNYSYNTLFGDVSSDLEFGALYPSRQNINNIELNTYLNSIDFSVGVESRPKRRYRAKYHKIAYFEYNNSIYTETQKNTIDAQTNNVERYAFGKYSFVPYPVGPVKGIRESGDSAVEKANPIIRVGKSSSSTQRSQGNVGTFNDSIQIMATENVGNTDNGITSYYADNDTINYATASGVALGEAYFANRAMLGSFDIEQPEGLSLFISVIRTEKEGIDLMVRNQYSSGFIPLNVDGHGFGSGTISLFVENGPSRNAKETDLYVYGKDAVSGDPDLVVVGADIYDASGTTNLTTYGVVGSGAKRGTELFLAAPLEFPGKTMPLWIGKDIDSSGHAPLFIQPAYVTPGGWTLNTQDAKLFMSGSLNPNGVVNSGAPLYINGPDEWIVDYASGAPLYITTDIPATGATGNWVYNSGATLVLVEDGNQSAVELVIEGAIASTGSMPLYIERAWANALPLVVKNQNPTGVFPMSVSGAFVSTGDINLVIAPPVASGITMYTRGYVE